MCFSGSPLNRVSFLREDHDFLRGAFEHPSTKFIVYQHLSPLIKTPVEIAYAKWSDLKKLIPENPYNKTEKELIAEFDSSKDIPQLVFLGLDETDKEGFSYKVFTGAPQFAVDVTPKKTYEEAAKEVTDALLSTGLKFNEGPRAMNFPADVGMFGTPVMIPFATLICFCSCCICSRKALSGLEFPKHLLWHLWSSNIVCQCWRKTCLSTNR